ncbi:MAG: S8 family serine peptidase [Catenulisporales bacterium]|nr:S8 family serine peptidase [Catenulisporales bacterium]
MLPLLVAAPAAHADVVRSAQWPIAYLNLPEAWKTTKGAGITVAVLDTGVMGTRADLTGQVTAGPDLVGGKEKPGDPEWGVHGTGMASLIAGHGHGAGNSDGIMGVAPQAKILSVRVIRDEESPDRGLLELSQTPISEGIRYAVDHGAQVISMSLGGTVAGVDSDTTHEADAVRYAIAHGVSVVVAAGNGGKDPAKDVTEYPAGERGVIGVAAVDRYGERAEFSSTGWDVAVAAPGVGIPMALPVDDPSGDTYAEFGPVIGSDTLIGAGTSPACAYVAGVVALIRSENPALSPMQIAQILKRTTSHRPAHGRDDQLGNGIVDPVAALKAAADVKGLPATPSAPPYKGPKYFGFGPETVAEQSLGGWNPRQRGIADAAVAMTGSLLLAAWFVLRGRRKAQVAVPISSFGVPDVAASTPVSSFGEPDVATSTADPAAAPSDAPSPPTTVEPMTDFAGRTLAPSAFPDDTGTADPALLSVLEAHGRGEAAVEHAYGYLLNARVLAPIVAVLGEAEEVPDEQGRNLRRDKNSDMALVTLVAPDGTRALPVFTSVAALAAWNAEARPMPVAFPRACAAAKAEGAEIVLVDLQQPSFLEVEPAAVRAFAAVLEKAEAGDDAS